MGRNGKTWGKTGRRFCKSLSRHENIEQKKKWRHLGAVFLLVGPINQ